VHVRFVIEAIAAPYQVSPIKDRVCCAEHEQISEKVFPADLATRDHMTRVRKAGPTNSRSLQGVSADYPDGRILLGERNHFLQAFGKDPIVSEDNLAIGARGGNVTQRSVVIFEGP